MIDEQCYYHALALAAHGEYHAMKRMRGGAGSWREAYAAYARSGAIVPDPAEAERSLARIGVRIVLSSESGFPGPLRHIAQPPFGLYVRGSQKALDRFSAAPERSGRIPGAIAVVGTRRASAEGKRTAREFAEALARAGFAIISGLAFGIDAAAHEGALDANGATVAVLAGGLDRVYPRAHEALARRIIAGDGALVSEYPPGETALGYRFIERNRIVSGLSDGVLIVEAPAPSGALATARYAAEQDRDLFVVPGGIRDERFSGSLSLIRQGAALVSSPAEILEGYGIRPAPEDSRAEKSASPEEILILRALAAIGAPADVDKISEITRLEPRIVNRALSFLLLRGGIKETDTGYTI